MLGTQTNDSELICEQFAYFTYKVNVDRNRGKINCSLQE